MNRTKRSFFAVAMPYAIMGAALAVLPPAWANPPLQTLEESISLKPLRIAAVDRDGRLLTDWIPYESGGGAGPANRVLLFDCYGVDWPTRERHFHGPGHRNIYFNNDMLLEPHDGIIDQFAFGWFWEVEERCVIYVWTSEGFDETCAGPAFSGQHRGVALDFGVVQPSAPRYHTTFVELWNFNLSLVAPQGRGGYQVLLARDEQQTPATMAQPMLWGTTPDTPGDSGPIQWDDLNFNLRFDPPDECLNYAWGREPDPLGAMFAAWGPEGSGRDYRLSLGGECPGRITVEWSGTVPNRTQAILVAPQQREVRLTGQHCIGTRLDIGPLNQIVVARIISTGSGGSGEVSGRAGSRRLRTMDATDHGDDAAVPRQ